MSLVQLLTEGTMLPGFAKGVTGMGVGERRLIHIPWKLGYGKKGRATSWDLQPQWFDDLEANFSGFRGICKHQHTVFQIALICFFFSGFWACQRLTPSNSEVVLPGKKPKIPPMSDLDFDASLTFCGVDWKERSNRSDAGLKRSECLLLSVYMLSIGQADASLSMDSCCCFLL